MVMPSLLDYLHNRDRHVAIAPHDDRIATSFIARTRQSFVAFVALEELTIVYRLITNNFRKDYYPQNQWQLYRGNPPL
ncbi:MAG: hypothetical protein ACOYJ1_13540, partial [Peptococcales bacterium]